MAAFDVTTEDGQVSASYDNQPGGRGEKLLRGYRAGDAIIAYASKCGVIGWGIVEEPEYEYVPENHDEFSETGFHRHRLRGIKWQSCSSTLKDAIPVKELNEIFGLKHPIQTKSRISADKAEALILEITRRFGAG
jgi:hypothetical protein